MIQRGLGATNDPIEAMKWFDLAVDQGLKRAMIFRDDFSVLLNPAQRQEARRRADAFKPQTIKGGIDPHFEVTVNMGDRFEIPVILFGQTNYLVVDTGSSASLLDLPFESRLGKSVGNGTVPMLLSTATNLPIYRCPGIDIGGERFAPLWARCVDFARLRTDIGGPCGGVLGMDLLKGYAFTFNPDDASFSISQFVPEEKKKRAMALPMQSDVGITYAPGIDGSANGRVIRFVLDSGAWGTVGLSPSDWQRVFPSGASNTCWVGTGDLESHAKTKAARLAKLQIGTNIYTNLIVTCDLGHQSELGLAFIRRHILTVDYPNETIYLQPARGFSEPDELNMSGMQLERKGQKTLVGFIDETSPAFKAGVRKNDEILSLNGQPTTSLELGAILKMFTRKAGDKIRVEVERDGKKMEFRFEVERVI
jgi:predicted aspartyl protease